MAVEGFQNLGFQEMLGTTDGLNMHGIASKDRADVTMTSAGDGGVNAVSESADATRPRADVEIVIDDAVASRADVIGCMADATKLVNSSVPKASSGVSNATGDRVSVWERLSSPTDGTKTFASVVGGIPKPELEFFPVKEDADARVHIPKKLTQGIANSYRSVVLGYFLGPRFPFPVVLRAVQNAWGKYGFVDATVNRHGYFFFRFNGEGGCSQVVESSPLMIKGVPLFVTQWDPSKGIHKPVHTTCPLWVKLFNVPLVAFNKEGISRIASAIGVPLRMDACTANTCDKLWGRTNFAKVLVNVWAKGALKREIEVVIPRLVGDGEDVVKVVVEYDWEPSQCSICKVFGHTDGSCAKRTIRKEEVRPKETTSDGFQLPKRRQWQPKVSKGNPKGNMAESSHVTKDASVSDTMVGVGNIKQINVAQKPKEKSIDKGSEVSSIPNSISKPGEGEFCTLNAGRTPGGKDGVVHVPQVLASDPELVQSVVQRFKQQLQPRRGVVITDNSNRFAPLSSDEESDEDDMTIIDGDLAQGGLLDTLGAAPISLSQ